MKHRFFPCPSKIGRTSRGRSCLEVWIMFDANTQQRPRSHNFVPDTRMELRDRDSTRARTEAPPRPLSKLCGGDENETSDDGPSAVFGNGITEGGHLQCCCPGVRISYCKLSQVIPIGSLQQAVRFGGVGNQPNTKHCSVLDRASAVGKGLSVSLCPPMAS